MSDPTRLDDRLSIAAADVCECRVVREVVQCRLAGRIVIAGAFECSRCRRRAEAPR